MGRVVIGAFNIRNFGLKKLLIGNKTSVLIIKILRRYDICFIQEIRHNGVNSESMDLLTELLKRLNNKSKKYQGIISPRLGRSAHKERFIYIYRSDLFTLSQSLLVENHMGRLFERQPYCIRLVYNVKPETEISIIGVHVRPNDAVNELRALNEVFKYVKTRWNPSSFFSFVKQWLFNKSDYLEHKKHIGPLIIGDLNCGSNYVPFENRKSLKLFGKEFSWLIRDEQDTTVMLNTTYSYDRIVVPYNIAYKFSKSLPFLFDKVYALTETEALEISDHYPVETILQI